MSISQTEAPEAPPQRGDGVLITLRGGGTLAGTVASAYLHRGESRVSVSAGGKRYTRVAASVTVTRRAAEPLPARGGPQRAGEAAPNAGRRYPAEILTPAEVTAILDGCSRRAPTGIRNRALLMLLYRSGLRVSEALALRPAGVSQEQHSLRLLDTKSGKAQTRGYHPSAGDALSRWLDTRRALGISSRAPLFCTLSGEALSADYVRKMLRRMADRAGVARRAHPHGLRHTFAVELQHAGVTPGEISKLLGHSSIAVTARYLDHLTNKQAIDTLAATVLPAAG